MIFPLSGVPYDVTDELVNDYLGLADLHWRAAGQESIRRLPGIDEARRSAYRLASVPRSRNTVTVASGGRVVPWLAATGELAYTPESPPERDGLFQYGWILPSIFDPARNVCRHYWFGAQGRDDARELFDFWARARESRAERVALVHGAATADSITAPMAVYRAPARRGPGYLFIQHGSYQLVDAGEQPLLYRGDAGSGERSQLGPERRLSLPGRRGKPCLRRRGSAPDFGGCEWHGP